MRLAKVKLNGLFPVGIIRGTKFSNPTQMKDEPCVYCGKPGTTWEHVIPKSLGGKGFWNRVRACRKCNMSRSSTLFLIWMIQQRCLKNRMNLKKSPLESGGLITVLSPSQEDGDLLDKLDNNPPPGEG